VVCDKLSNVSPLGALRIAAAFYFSAARIESNRVDRLPKPTRVNADYRIPRPSFRLNRDPREIARKRGKADRSDVKGFSLRSNDSDSRIVEWEEWPS